MTIDEAIAHARDVANKQKIRSDICIQNDSECDKFSDCLKCAEEHEQLAEWLEELKAYRENSNSYNKEDIELNRNAMYNKAIDDFAILMKETFNHDWATTKISEQIIYNRLFDKCNEITQQLKAGGKNE